MSESPSPTLPEMGLCSLHLHSRHVHLLHQLLALSILVDPLDKLTQPINSDPYIYHIPYSMGHLKDNVVVMVSMVYLTSYVCREELQRGRRTYTKAKLWYYPPRQPRLNRKITSTLEQILEEWVVMVLN